MDIGAKYWLTKLRESVLSVLPIVIVIFALFFITRFALPADTFTDATGKVHSLTDNHIIGFSISVLMIILGMTLFSAGTEESMTEIGKIIGGSLVKKKNFFFVLAMTFILGVLVTVAEPDLSVLSGQIGMPPIVIILTIGLGVGLFLVIGVIRISLKQDLRLMFLAFYALAFTLIYLVDPRFLPICFDSGGVTTGPVTVPFLLGFGVGLSASRKGNSGRDSDDSFGLTALCSIGPILAIVIISLIMKAAGMALPETYPLSVTDSKDTWANFGSTLSTCLFEVALSVGPLLVFFIVYELIFIRLPAKTVLRVSVGMVITYVGLVLFLSGVSWGFMPVAQNVGFMFGSTDQFHYWAMAIGVLFGIFGVLAEPAIHVLVNQIEVVSDGNIRKGKVLMILAISNGVAVFMQVLRAHLQFPIVYYLIPGYIIAFVLTFLVPRIYTAMAFDSGGVASGPMTSTFVLPFCIGLAVTTGEDVYLYGFGLVAMVAMMPLIVIQGMGLSAVIKANRALMRARKRLVEENDDQIIHFNLEEEAA